MTRSYTVDILTTFCKGEPYEMIVTTLKAIKAIKYPHNTYLCDEADDPYLRRVCEELGVVHVTRTIKKDAKAGNINNALRQATGEICVVLDPDHIPVPNFMDHVLPYFDDPEIGFVQCVQAYYNRNESLVAYGAAEQTYSFYGPMMMCMGNYGTAQAIGANCTFRRSALDSIGGHAAGLSEDMHTAMQLHAKGWKSVYVPKPLSYGLVPSTLAGFYKQQLKWSRGTFELLFVTYPKLFSRFTWRQKIHYLTIPLYFLIGVIQFIDLLVPICALVMMRLPLRLDLELFALAYLPLLLMAFLIRQYSQRWLIEKKETGFHIMGGLLCSGTWWIYALGFIYTLFRVDVPYLPTPKNDRPQNNFLLCLPNLLMTFITLGAIAYSVYYYEFLSIGNRYVQMMIGFGLINVLIMGLNVVLGQEKFLASLREMIQRSSFRTSRWTWVWRVRYRLYGYLRASALPLYGIMLLLTSAQVSYTFRNSFRENEGEVRYANTQPFYFSFSSVRYQPASLSGPIQSVIIPQHLTFPTNGTTVISDLKWTRSPHDLPLLYLEPDVAVSPGDSSLLTFLSDLRKGKYDPVLTRFADQVKRYDRPVLAAFAPGFDNTAHSWGTLRGHTLFEYQLTFQYLADFYQKAEVKNITWVWCPTHPHTISYYYPGNKYVDWIGLRVVNDPATAPDGESHSFSALYQPLRNAITRSRSYSLRQKPVLITQLETTASNDRHQWRTQAFSSIYERFTEIRGVLMNQ
ncbi:glycosyltransferase family 2 protein [Larkinella soli]|uniref:glycosyltransferase family 2 protein n=1 Tax=Larkinella soli TaxID=1770527 RepID=UPI001E3BEE17|nr:glycosyltransferase [Larkinella soli]